MNSIRWTQWLVRAAEFVLDATGLRITELERQTHGANPYNIFDEVGGTNKPQRTAGTIAILLHILLFLLVFPTARIIYPIETNQMIVLKTIRPPSPPGGGGGKPKTAPPKVEAPIPKPAARSVPIPDPTPDDPEPIVSEQEPTIDIVDRISTAINLGDVTAPPGPGGLGGSGGGTGTGRGSGVGPGYGGGEGGGPFRVGGGVREPVLIYKTLPGYTEEARKNRVEGLVLLEVVVRANGTVDNARVVRGLGFGLDESALKEVVTKWKFKPGTLDGRPVDVWALIEVSFRLL